MTDRVTGHCAAAFAAAFSAAFFAFFSAISFSFWIFLLANILSGATAKGRRPGSKRRATRAE